MLKGRRLLSGTLLVLLGACEPAEPPPRLQVAGGDPERGRALMEAHGCGACHVVPGLRGARGRVGPSLEGLARRSVIAGALANTPTNLIAWIRDPVALRPETAMPVVGASPEEARHMAAYLLAQGTRPAARPIPGPRLPTVPEDAAAGLEVPALEELAQYRWVDPQAGIAAIPIERAIELLAERGVESFNELEIR